MQLKSALAVMLISTFSFLFLFLCEQQLHQESSGWTKETRCHSFTGHLFWPLLFFPRPSSHLQPFFLFYWSPNWGELLLLPFSLSLSTQFGGLYARVVEVTNDKNTRKMLQPVGSFFPFLFSLSLFFFPFFSFLRLLLLLCWHKSCFLPNIFFILEINSNSVQSEWVSEFSPVEKRHTFTSLLFCVSLSFLFSFSCCVFYFSCLSLQLPLIVREKWIFYRLSWWQRQPSQL